MNELMEILSPVLGGELARDIIAHRRGVKCPLTPRGARSLLKQYEATGDAVAAAEEHLNRGWIGFKAEWMTKPTRFQDQRNPYQVPAAANYGNPKREVAPPPKDQATIDRIRRLKENALRGMLVK